MRLSELNETKRLVVYEKLEVLRETEQVDDLPVTRMFEGCFRKMPR
jgi:hypothetical protein